MERLQQNFQSIESMRDQLLQTQTKTKDVSKNETSFQEIFSAQKEQAGSLKFSKHAGQRLAARDINLTDSQVKRLEDGTTKAREKGIQESLVMVDNLAFIVNVKSNTVVTAVNDTSDSIFTNIDGAVIS